MLSCQVGPPSRMLTSQQSIGKQADYLTCSFAFVPIKNEEMTSIPSLMMIGAMLSVSTQPLAMI